MTHQLALAQFAAKVLRSSENTIIRHILLDSRQLSSPENSIFFALIGARNDGHKYIQDLYKKGIRNFVISEELIDTASLIDCNFLKVENTLLSLQQLARYHREQFTIPVMELQEVMERRSLKNGCSNY